MKATNHHRSRIRGKASKNQLSSNFRVILFYKSCSYLTAKLKSFRRSKRPPIQTQIIKPAAPNKKKKVPPRIQGPPEAGDHHCDAVPQLHEKLLYHGRHGRQQRNEHYSVENPRPMPISPRRYPVRSPSPEYKRIAGDFPDETLNPAPKKENRTPRPS